MSWLVGTNKNMITAINQTLAGSRFITNQLAKYRSDACPNSLNDKQDELEDAKKLTACYLRPSEHLSQTFSFLKCSQLGLLGFF